MDLKAGHNLAPNQVSLALLATQIDLVAISAVDLEHPIFDLIFDPVIIIFGSKIEVDSIFER